MLKYDRFNRFIPTFNPICQILYFGQILTFLHENTEKSERGTVVMPAHLLRIILSFFLSSSRLKSACNAFHNLSWRNAMSVHYFILYKYTLYKCFTQVERAWKSICPVYLQFLSTHQYLFQEPYRNGVLSEENGDWRNKSRRYRAETSRRCIPSSRRPIARGPRPTRRPFVRLSTW